MSPDMQSHKLHNGCNLTSQNATLQALFTPVRSSMQNNRLVYNGNPKHNDGTSHLYLAQTCLLLPHQEFLHFTAARKISF